MATDTLNLPPDLKQALDQAVAAIVEVAHPRLVILFGSWAEGKAREGSDVDLVVVADTDDPLRLGVAVNKRLFPMFGAREYDLLVYSWEEWREAREIIGFLPYEADRHGVRLYERPS